MGRISIRTDDVEERRENYVKATRTDIPIAFGRWKGKIDLSEENYQTARKVFGIWFDAIGIDILGDEDDQEDREPERSPIVVAVPTAAPTAATGDGDENEFALMSDSGRRVKLPGMKQFAESLGMKFHPSQNSGALVDLYKEARRSGEFVPDPLRYPPHKNKALAGA